MVDGEIRAGIEGSESQSSAAADVKTRRRRVVVGASVGSAIEYYDFSVYAFLASTLSVVFFPGESQTAGLLYTFAVFAVAFVLRPVGGILIGHLADRYGRRPALATAVIGMAVPTALIGVLPGYAAIGVAAPIMLVLLRVIQGLAAGGEVGGASVYVAEAAPAERRGLYGSTTQIGVYVGTALGPLVVGLLRLGLTPEQMTAWGWRIPFLVSVPLSLAAILYRRRLEESSDFTRAASKSAISRMPAVEMLRSHPAAVVRTTALNLVAFGGYYLTFTYMATYLPQQGLVSTASAGWAVLMCLVFAAFGLPAWAAVSDRIGRRPIFIGVCLGFLVLPYPLFLLMSTSFLGAVVALLVLGQLQAAINGAQSATFSEMFPPHIRTSGVALGFNIASLLAGGVSPYLATWLIDRTGDARSPAYYLMFLAVVSLVFAVTMRETAGKPLPQAELPASPVVCDEATDETAGSDRREGIDPR
ncbi:L-Proline/Glycine betaine transporter ProP [Pseudonocardia sp. Ae707_Ps1]|nr:L-Proline/Glycine betaine transporter ProP [Pseudonocardia sp. Ae707_Ps1]